MGWEDGKDRIIDTTKCWVCDAEPGEPCTPCEGQTANDIGRCHGMRIDDFMGEGSFEDRLAEHLEMMESARAHVGPKTWAEMNEQPLMFTAEEYLEHTGKTWPPETEVE